MDIDKFRDDLIVELDKTLNNGADTYSIEKTEVKKINVDSTAIAISLKNSCVGASIGLENLVEWLKGQDIDESKYVEEAAAIIIKDIADRFTDETIQNVQELVEKINDYDFVKHVIYPVLISIDGNQALLNKKPYITLTDDLAIVYRIMMSDANEPTSLAAAVDVNTEMMNHYGITVDEMHAQAIKNLNKKGFPQAFCIFELVAGANPLCYDVMSKTFDPMLIAMSQNLIVVTNIYGKYGASTILHHDLMEKIRTDLNVDELYIIPSSIHECIVMPAVDGIDTVQEHELKEFVKAVNGNEVPEDEILIDGLYVYDGSTLKSIGD